ncbi:hypothetical protein Tco_0337818 [Tanacetum coccineum]
MIKETSEEDVNKNVACNRCCVQQEDQKRLLVRMMYIRISAKDAWLVLLFVSMMWMGYEKSKRTTFILINVGSIKDNLKWTHDMMSCVTRVHVVCAWVLDLYYGVHGFDSFAGVLVSSTRDEVDVRIRFNEMLCSTRRPEEIACAYDVYKDLPKDLMIPVDVTVLSLISPKDLMIPVDVTVLSLIRLSLYLQKYVGKCLVFRRQISELVIEEAEKHCYLNDKG